MPERAQTPAYVGRCPGCSAIVAAHVDDGSMPDRVAEFVADQVRTGRILERVTVEVVRNGEFGCNCPSTPGVV